MKAYCCRWLSNVQQPWIRWNGYWWSAAFFWCLAPSYPVPIVSLMRKEMYIQKRWEFENFYYFTKVLQSFAWTVYWISLHTMPNSKAEIVIKMASPQVFYSVSRTVRVGVDNCYGFGNLSNLLANIATTIPRYQIFVTKNGNLVCLQTKGFVLCGDVCSRSNITKNRKT
jgi:hypothetical protein